MQFGESDYVIKKKIALDQILLVWCVELMKGITMQPHVVPHWRYSTCRVFRLAGIIAWAVIVAGCDKEDRVAWLPDSSGFIYTTSELAPSIILYDVKRKASRTLVTKFDSIVYRPSVSFEGNRFAVLRATEGKKGFSCRVVIFDLNGRIISESPAVTGKSEFDEDNKFLTARRNIQWSPTGDHILWRIDDVSGVLDVKKNQNRVLPGIRAEFAQEIKNPIRPDGSGFLATVMPDKLLFVTWDGWETELVMAPEAKEFLKTPPEEVRERAQMSYKEDAIWNKDTLTVHTMGYSFVVDTARHTVSLVRDPKVISRFKELDEARVQSRVILASEAALQVRLVRKIVEPKTEVESSLYRLEWVESSGKRVRSLSEEFEGISSLSCSPNRMYATASFKIAETANDWSERVLIFDKHGSRIDEFTKVHITPTRSKAR